MTSGDLRWRVRFDQRGLDANNERLGEFESSADPVAAHIRFLVGTEPVMQQRLNGVQPVVITIRDCAAARLVTPAHRAVDTRAAVAYDIKGVKPAAQSGFLEITALSQGGSDAG